MSLTIKLADHGGVYVTEQLPADWGPRALRVVFAGTLAQCLRYVERKLTPKKGRAS